MLRWFFCLVSGTYTVHISERYIQYMQCIHISILFYPIPKKTRLFGLICFILESEKKEMCCASIPLMERVSFFIWCKRNRSSSRSHTKWKNRRGLESNLKTSDILLKKWNKKLNSEKKQNNFKPIFSCRHVQKVATHMRGLWTFLFRIFIPVCYEDFLTESWCHQISPKTGVSLLPTQARHYYKGNP